MTARWMGVDLTAYEGVALPFADADIIPAWSLPAVKAMHALGSMQGSQCNDGLFAYATASITRAEAMTILGRIQPRGYATASLNSFTDAATVPTWASEYVALLVQQGVVSGSDGKLRPNDAVSRAEVSKMLVSIW